MADNGCKREMTFEEELLAYDARITELLFAEDEYPGDSLLKSVLRDSKRILSKAKVKIEALQMDNKQLQSDVITANQYYEHTKEQLEKAIKISQRSNQRFIEAKKELEETQEKLEALLCEATGGKLSKHSYTAEVMTTQAHEHLLKCCDDERTAAVKEFADNLKKDIQDHSFEMFMNGLKGTPRTNEITYETVWEYIDNLVKEMVGES